MKSFRLDAGYSDIDVREYEGGGFLLTVDSGDCVYLSSNDKELLVNGLQELLKQKGECNVG